MRKFILALAGAVALVALTANLAVGASRRAKDPAPTRCGTLYTPPCKGPAAVVRSKIACQNSGTVLRFPVSASGSAGLREVTVHFGGKTIKVVHYTGAPLKKTLTVVINSKGFKPGLYSLTVKVTDVLGKTVTKVAHFTICTPKPVFTG